MSAIDPASIPQHVVDAARVVPNYVLSEHERRCAIAAALTALMNDEDVWIRSSAGHLVRASKSDVLAAVLDGS